MTTHLNGIGLLTVAVCKPFVKRSRFVLFFLSILCIFFLASPAIASFSLLPSLTVSGEYNDNFFLTSPDKEEDFKTVIFPALTLKYENPSAILAVNYRGGAEFHINNKERDAYRQNFNFDMILPRRFDRVDVHILEILEYTPDLAFAPIGGRAREVQGTVIARGAVNTFRNIASMGLSYGWSPRWVTDLNYRNAIVKYRGPPPRDGPPLEDFVSHDIDIYGKYNLSYRTEINMGYGILNTRFESSQGFTAPRVKLGGRHQAAHNFFISGSVGESFLPQTTGEFIYDAGLSKRLKRTDFSLNYAQHVTTGEGVSPAATLERGVTADVTYAMSERTSLFFRVDRSNTSRLSDTASLNTILENATGSITTRFLPWLSGSALYTYTYSNFQEGGITTRDAKRNVMTLFLTASDTGLKLIK